MDANLDPEKSRVPLKQRAEEVAEYMRKTQERIDTLRKAYSRIADTEDGRLVFDHIRKLCGHNQSPMRTTQQGLLNNEISWALQGRIEVYLDLRPFLPEKLVSEIEKHIEPKSEGK